MASIISIVPIVLLFVLMLGFKMAGHKSAFVDTRSNCIAGSSPPLHWG